MAGSGRDRNLETAVGLTKNLSLPSSQAALGMVWVPIPARKEAHNGAGHRLTGRGLDNRAAHQHATWQGEIHFVRDRSLGPVEFMDGHTEIPFAVATECI